MEWGHTDFTNIGTIGVGRIEYDRAYYYLRTKYWRILLNAFRKARIWARPYKTRGDEIKIFSSLDVKEADGVVIRGVPSYRYGGVEGLLLRYADLYMYGNKKALGSWFITLLYKSAENARGLERLFSLYAILALDGERVRDVLYFDSRWMGKITGTWPEHVYPTEELPGVSLRHVRFLAALHAFLKGRLPFSEPEIHVSIDSPIIFELYRRTVDYFILEEWPTANPAASGLIIDKDAEKMRQLIRKYVEIPPDVLSQIISEVGGDRAKFLKWIYT